MVLILLLELLLPPSPLLLPPSDTSELSVEELVVRESECWMGLGAGRSGEPYAACVWMDRNLDEFMVEVCWVEWTQ